MPVLKSFDVFGDRVEVLVSSEETAKSFCVVTQTCRPGGGPPPHSHKAEDEVFTVLEGEFELFDGDQWRKVRAGETAYGMRDGVHTFRNSGMTVGKIQVIAVPGAGLDAYLEAISDLRIPEDMERLLAISDQYGIAFAAPAQK